MKASPVTIYTGLISFLIGLVCGGILIGSPRESYLAVVLAVIAAIAVYTLYLWRIGGKS